MTASERDLRTLTGIVSDHRADLPAERLPPSLMSQIRGDRVWFAGFDSGRQAYWSGQEIPYRHARAGGPGSGGPGHYWTRTTMRYDRGSLDRHATYIVAAYVAGAPR